MNNILRTLICLVIALALLASNLSCINIVMPSKDRSSNSSRQIPVVTPKTVGPATFDLPGQTTEIQVSSQKGATFEKDGASIIVPPGALAGDGVISIKEFSQPPPLYAAPEGSSPLPVAVSISKAYDLCPEGIEFNKPVQVTLPYDKSLLRPDVDESNIALSYFNGKDWVSAGGLVDTEKGTVTVAITAFPGFVVTIALFAIAAGAFGIAGHKVYEHYKGDPVSNDKAKDYVTPDNPVIQEHARRAGVNVTERGNAKWVPLVDPNQPGQVNPDFAKLVKEPKSGSRAWDIDRIGFGGSDRVPGDLPTYSKDSNWETPDKYLSSGMKGDCTNVANAYLSMFRSAGIKAYGVDGYKSNTGQGSSRHAWVELYIDGEAYYYDNDEGVKPLKDVEQSLSRPTGLKGEGFMWDESGQKRYVKDWWTALRGKEGQLGISGDFTLSTTMYTPTDSWQDVMVVELFKATPIKVQNGIASASNSRPFSITNVPVPFQGTGYLEIAGTYDVSTGMLNGTYEYGWEGELYATMSSWEKITYSGKFQAKILRDDKQCSIDYPGTVEATYKDKNNDGAWGTPWSPPADSAWLCVTYKVESTQ